MENTLAKRGIFCSPANPQDSPRKMVIQLLAKTCSTIVRDLHYSQKGEAQIPVLRCPVHGCSQQTVDITMA